MRLIGGRMRLIGGGGVVCFSLLLLAAGAVRYEGCKTLRLFGPLSAEVESALNNTKLVTSQSSDVHDVIFHGDDEDELQHRLRQHKLRTAIGNPDLAAAISRERRRRSAKFLHNSYHSFTEIGEWLELMAARCSTCRLREVGRSSQGRPLLVLQAGSGSKSVWIDAGYHAREWIAPASALYLLDQLTGNSSESSALRDSATWYVLAVANPDGYVFTWTEDRMWRKTRSRNRNCRCVGTDANRNWDFHWGGHGTSSLPCHQNYHGRSAFSEPETLRVANFLRGLGRSLTVYLSLHSYGQYWLFPWGFTKTLARDSSRMRRAARRANTAIRKVSGSRFRIGQSSRMLYLAAGGSDDWVKETLGVTHTYTLELRDTGTHGFLLPASRIVKVGRELQVAVTSLVI